MLSPLFSVEEPSLIPRLSCMEMRAWEQGYHHSSLIKERSSLIQGDQPEKSMRKYFKARSKIDLLEKQLIH